MHWYAYDWYELIAAVWLVPAGVTVSVAAQARLGWRRWLLLGVLLGPASLWVLARRVRKAAAAGRDGADKPLTAPQGS